MLVNKFDFNLPESFIADFPVEPRDHAKMMVYSKEKERVVDDFFYNLPNYLDENDVIVFNNTKVIPARFRTDKYFKGEILFLEEVDRNWKVMVRPGRKFKENMEYQFGDLKITVNGIDDDGFRYLSINLDKNQLLNYLRENGEMPVPPYISGRNFNEDDYNTVYSEIETSVAAPTAGLHFTSELIEKIKNKGCKVEFVSLSVGLGTFLPVKVADTKEHKMHSENYQMKDETAENLNKYVHEGKRIIAVGTTSIRVLEDNFERFGEFRSGKFNTNIFIEPGYEWKVVNGIITNFHLPKSTLIMLVSAFVGREKIIELYERAMKKEYRFYSFGDGMLLI